MTLVSTEVGVDPAEVLAHLLPAHPADVVVSGFEPPSLTSAGHRVHGAQPEVVHLEAGCDCCALRWDLIEVLTRLARSSDRRRVVVVLDHDADVATAVQTLLGDAELRRTCVLDATVHLLDASTHLERMPPGAPAGPTDVAMAFADHVIVGGAGRLTPDVMSALRRSVRARAAMGSLTVTPDAATAALTTPAAGWTLGGVAARRFHRPPVAFAEGGGTLRWVEAGLTMPVDPDRIHDWLDHLTSLGSDLLRIDGVLDVAGEDRSWAVLGVRTTIELGEPILAGADRHQGPYGSSIRLVGRSLDPFDLVGTFQGCCTQDP